MRMRKVSRITFENPAIKQDPMYQFNQQRAADLYFARKLAEAKAAKTAAASKYLWELRLPLFFYIRNILFNYILYI